ncbi:MAG: isoprenylcysteine carboxylmethyltransferase family protein [Lachnospiraceae bacterium]|nr:isoprenylcysteine carboxylmethyltransferase family protein [Lachnospiraceae bacterium]
MDRSGVIPAVCPAWGRLLFIILGAAFALFGISLWVKAVLKDKVDDGIIENRLVTSGAYAIVRNPIYSAFMLLFSGILFINGNVLTFILPFLYWLFMTVLMKKTEEIWLAERYGDEYVLYCRRVNRCIPGVSYKDAVYESNISDVRWIAYDLPGNVGWILYFVGLILSFVKMPAYMEHETMFQLAVVAVIPALLMLVGIVELVGERIHKLDRVLPRIRLMRGFGALTLGGITGVVIGVIILICGTIYQVQDLLYIWFMAAGGILCSVFAWLLFRRYQRQ